MGLYQSPQGPSVALLPYIHPTFSILNLQSIETKERRCARDGRQQCSTIRRGGEGGAARSLLYPAAYYVGGVYPAVAALFSFCHIIRPFGSIGRSEASRKAFPFWLFFLSLHGGKQRQLVGFPNGHGNMLGPTRNGHCLSQRRVLSHGWLGFWSQTRNGHTRAVAVNTTPFLRLQPFDLCS